MRKQKRRIQSGFQTHRAMDPCAKYKQTVLNDLQKDLQFVHELDIKKMLMSTTDSNQLKVILNEQRKRNQI